MCPGEEEVVRVASYTNLAFVEDRQAVWIERYPRHSVINAEGQECFGECQGDDEADRVLEVCGRIGFEGHETREVGDQKKEISRNSCLPPQTRTTRKRRVTGTRQRSRRPRRPMRLRRISFRKMALVFSKAQAVKKRMPQARWGRRGALGKVYRSLNGMWPLV